MSKIASAGVYPHLSITDYHNDCCVGVSVSKSALPIAPEPPAKAWARSYLNPHRVPRDSAAMGFGRAAHALVLGEPEFNAHWIVSPFDDFRKKEAQAWRDGQTKEIVKADDLTTIEAMARALRTTPQTAQAFGNEGQPEASIVWQCEDTGLWLKARPDWLPADPQMEFIREYKTCVTIEPRRLSVDAFRYAYDCQAAMIVDGITAVTGTRPLGVAHIVQEKEPPYLCDLRLFSPEQIDAGRTRYRHALRIFYRCLNDMERGVPPHIAWPGYTTEATYFETPSWLMNQVVEMDDEHPNNSSANGFGEVLAAV